MMIDKLLNIGCAFDWITPFIAFLQDLFFAHPSDFGIPVNPYWGIREIKHLLRNYDINVWGLMYDLSGEMLMFTVQKRQADLTYYLLLQAGIPILYAPNVRSFDFLEPYQ
ncbi:MAG: hypothetical protein ABSF99_12735 [Anaerolineales bacterium]